ncbi:hypothetical protein J2R99_000463 [Rhodopseudomonas julia]|uniref:Uncharacterized protein n=1 Tax=Rhodopseudomonas julia TaxID=200617 RepID=A0ABU0C271_9BRAD|nr:hypothetical protein [Rhodopseudomonas julia]MDQ0324614.1 hypothetical protein [Rhodopseudomonas julia]
MGRINWASVIPTCVFFFVLWLLQGQLSTLHDAIETTCGDTSCGREIGVAFQLLSLSTLVSALAVAWASWRFNTAFHIDRNGA